MIMMVDLDLWGRLVLTEFLWVVMGLGNDTITSGSVAGIFQIVFTC